MKNPRLVKALKEMNDARWSASDSASDSAWSAWSAYWSASRAAETNEKEVLEILKEKFNEKSKIS